MEFIETLTLVGIAVKSIINYFFKDKVSNIVKLVSELTILALIIVSVILYFTPASIGELTTVLLKGTFVFGSIYGLGYAVGKGIENSFSKKDK